MVLCLIKKHNDNLIFLIWRRENDVSYDQYESDRNSVGTDYEAEKNIAESRAGLFGTILCAKCISLAERMQHAVSRSSLCVIGTFSDTDGSYDRWKSDSADAG